MTIVLSLQFYVCFMCSYSLDMLAIIRVACQRMTSILNLTEVVEQRTQKFNFR